MDKLLLRASGRHSGAEITRAVKFSKKEAYFACKIEINKENLMALVTMVWSQARVNVGNIGVVIFCFDFRSQMAYSKIT